MIFKPMIQLGVTLNENAVPSSHVTTASPVRECPGLHFNDTSLPGGRGNCESDVILFQLEGKLSHETADQWIRISTT